MSEAKSSSRAAARRMAVALVVLLTAAALVPTGAFAAPNTPSLSGPTNVPHRQDATYTSTITDNAGYPLALVLNWGDGTTTRVPDTGFVASGTTVSATHAWDAPGYQTINYYTENSIGQRSYCGWYGCRLSVYVSNLAPEVPTVDVPEIATPGDIPFTITAADPDGDRVKYEVRVCSWGCSTESASPLVDSGTPATVYVNRVYEGTYNFRVYAVDEFGAENYLNVQVRVATPPTAPVITGPVDVFRFDNHTWTFRSEDAGGHRLAYYVNWGDGERTRIPASGYVNQGVEVSAVHNYGLVGVNTISVYAVDTTGVQGAEATLAVTVTSPPPSVPQNVTGLPLGFSLLETEFNTYSTDIHDDPIAYLYDWGDGTVSRVPEVGYLQSGEMAYGTHAYAIPGVYEVRVTAVDMFGSASEPSNPKEVTVFA